MKHRRINNIRPNVIRGGQAIPIGSNFYYMQGRKHEQGGIDVGKDLEVEGDEVMQITPKSIKVYSTQPILNGVSPAQAVLGGENPNKVFKAQEEFKDRFNLNDDGTKKGKSNHAGLGKNKRYKRPSPKPGMAMNSIVSKVAKYITDDLPVDTVRQRLYDNLNPYTYYSPIYRVKSAVKDNKNSYTAMNPYTFKDDIWAEYLSIPKDKRHNLLGYVPKVIDSKYEPTKNSLFETNYKTLDHIKKSLIDDVVYDAFHETILKNADNVDGIPVDVIEPPLQIGDNKTSKALDVFFASHKIGRGLDKNNGEYVSFYDNWDLAPVSGKNNTKNDETMGIGNPIEFYDRIYLDDYYDVDKQHHEDNAKTGYYGGYLPEIVVTNNTNTNRHKSIDKKVMGGKLTIVPFTGRGKQSNTTVARMGAKKARLGYNDNNEFINALNTDYYTFGYKPRYLGYQLPEVTVVGNKLNSSSVNRATPNLNRRDNLKLYEAIYDYANFHNKDSNLGDIKQTPITLNIAKPKNDKTDIVFSAGEFPEIVVSAPANKNNKTSTNTASVPTPVVTPTTTTESVEDNQEYIPTKVLNHDYISPNGLIDYSRFIRPFRGTTPATTSTRRSRNTGQGRGTKPTNVKLDFGDTPVIDRSTPELIRSKGDLVPNSINVNVNNDISGVTPPSIANPKVFNSTKSPKTPSNFKSFIKNNAEDIIGGASNLIGSVGSYIANNIALNRMKAPSEPAYKMAAKMKTTYNSNPEEDANRESYHRGVRSIRNNTASSNVAQNRINRLNLAMNEARNRIRANKENIETQLINQDKLNQQQVANANVDTYNQYIDRVNQFMNKKLEMKSENNNALIAGLNNVVQSTITNRQKRRQFDNNLKLINAMTPDVVKYLSKRV